MSASTATAWGGVLRHHYRAALLRRSVACPDDVRRHLEARLQALPSENGAAVPQYKHLEKRAASQLAELVASLSARDAVSGPNDLPELAALRAHRSTWTQLGVDRHVTSALARAPTNAGPLNSHHLALSTLNRLRSLSPDYLRHLVSHIDALLCLEDAVRKVRPPRRKPKAGKTPTP